MDLFEDNRNKTKSELTFSSKEKEFLFTTTLNHASLNGDYIVANLDENHQ